MNKAQAKSLGLPRYIGNPCALGHGGERYTSCGHCVECERIKARKKYEKAKELILSRQKLYRDSNSPKIREKNSRYYQSARETLLHKRAQRRDCEGHLIRSVAAQWRKRNPDKIAAKNRNCRAIRKSSEGRHTAAEIKALYARQNGKCVNCLTSLAPGYHVDHIVPLIRGGSNWISNIQLLCPPCNIRKGAKMPDEWAREQGRLL